MSMSLILVKFERLPNGELSERNSENIAAAEIVPDIYNILIDSITFRMKIHEEGEDSDIIEMGVVQDEWLDYFIDLFKRHTDNAELSEDYHKMLDDIISILQQKKNIIDSDVLLVIG